MLFQPEIRRSSTVDSSSLKNLNLDKKSKSLSPERSKILSIDDQEEMLQPLLLLEKS